MLTANYIEVPEYIEITHVPIQHALRHIPPMHSGKSPRIARKYDANLFHPYLSARAQSNNYTIPLENTASPTNLINEVFNEH